MKSMATLSLLSSQDSEDLEDSQLVAFRRPHDVDADHCLLYSVELSRWTVVWRLMYVNVFNVRGLAQDANIIIARVTISASILCSIPLQHCLCLSL